MDRFDEGTIRLTYGCGQTTCTINARYVVFASDNGLLVQGLDDSSESVWQPDCALGYPGRPFVLQLASVTTDWLATSCGSQTLIRNLKTRILEHAILGNGRSVTAFAWSQHSPNLLAIGTVDGSVSIWSLAAAAKRFHHLSATGSACQTIIFSPHDDQMLAVSHHNLVHIWFLQSTRKPITTLVSSHGMITNLAWNPVRPSLLLATTSNGSSVMWEVPCQSTLTIDRDIDDDDMDVFGNLDDLQATAQLVGDRHVLDGVSHVVWISQRSLFSLTSGTQEIVYHEFDVDMQATKEIARVSLRNDTEALALRSSYGRLCIKTYSLGQMHTHEVPAAVISHTSQFLDVDESNVGLNTDGQVLDERAISAAPGLTDPEIIVPKMRPHPISRIRNASGRSVGMCGSARTQKSKGPDLGQSSPTRISAKLPTSTKSSTLQDMTSSLELPEHVKEHNSPMPFLSPSIPARKPPADPSVVESVYFPQLPDSSLPNVSGSPEHDSDSDDEIFTPGVTGTGIVMPGGVNVPLPRTCGALFGPAGQLIMFLPPKPQPSLSHPVGGSSVQAQRPEKQTRMAKVFPAFGNLVAEDAKAMKSGYLASSLVAIHASSLHSRLTWQSGTSSPRIDSSPFEDPHTTDVKVYDLAALLPLSRKVVEECRVFCCDNESGAGLCRHNAEVADECQFDDAGNIWRLLAMLLEDSVPLQLLSNGGAREDVIVIAREVTRFDADGSRIVEQEHQGKLRWAEHPLGATWLIEQIFLWAEQSADVHMLACVSAMLCQGDETVLTTPATAQQSVLTRLPSFSKSFSLEIEHWPSSRSPFHSDPPLLANTRPLVPSQESPMKLRQTSMTSSRNASLPTTPHLESSSSTPPFIFPGLSRHGSRLSTSGSVSPEHHRSSFSATAKYYAQSITDKISSYGTSPPLKRLGTSPRTNELSTSLPAGSWSKSVSFASAVSTTRDSQLSKSFTTGEDEYDSDKTIEEASLPHTPRSTTGEVTIRLKSPGLFADERSGGVVSPLIPDHLAAKAAIWRHHYAGQLRIWRLWIQAAELEKVSSLSTGTAMTNHAHEGMSLARAPGKRWPVCTICLSTIRGLQQACPVCLHTAHLECLADYVRILNGEMFACPAGCDCVCTELPLESVGFQSADLMESVSMLSP